jgi:hypothetical protein
LPRRPRRPHLEILESRLAPAAVSWTGHGDGTSWGDPNNWNTGTLPGSADDVTINVTNAVVKYSSGTTTVNSITNSDTLDIQGGGLTTNGAVQINKVLTMDGGTLTVGGAFNVSTGTLNFNGGTLASTATLVGSTLNIGQNATSAATFILEGADTLTGNVAAGQTLTVQGISGVGNATLTLAGNVTNAGTITLQSVNTNWNETLATGSFSLTNAAAGTIQVSAGSGGGRAITGTLVNQGQVAVDSSSLLAISGTYNAAGGSITGPGYLTNCTLDVTVSPSSPTTIPIGGKGVTLATNNLANTTLLVQGNNPFGDATLTVKDGLSNQGTIQLQSITSNWNETLATGAGTFTNTAGGTIQVSAGTGGGRAITGTLVNQGQVAVDSTSLLAISGTYNAAGGSITGPGYLTNCTLDVTGSPSSPTTILIGGAGDTLATNNLANTTLWVQGNNPFGNATLTVANGLTNQGTIQLQSITSNWNETLATGSGTFTNAAAGTIQVSAGTGGGRVITGTLVNQGQVAVDSTSLLAISGTYYAAGGSITGPGYLFNCTLDVTASPASPTTILIGGTGDTLATNNLANTTLWVQGNSYFGFGDAKLTVANGLTNQGTIQLQSITSNWNETLATGSGTFTNAAAGTIQVNNGTGGGRTISGTLVNQGQIVVDTASLLTITGAYNEAGGTISGPGYLINCALQVTASPSNPTTIVAAGGGDTLAGNNLAGTTVWVQGNSIFGSAALTVNDGVSNSGTILLQSVNSNWAEALTTGTGTLTNAAGGTIQVSAGTGGGRSFTGNLTNAGAVNVGPSITFTVNSTSATVTFTNQGQVAVDPAGFMTIGQTYNSAGGTISGPGDLVNATLQVSVAPAPATTLILAGADTLATNNPANMTLWVQGNSTIGAAALTVNNGLSNSGTILLQAVNAAWTSTLATGTGTLTNAAGGTIQVSAGTGGGRVFVGNLVNQGLVSVGPSITFTANNTSAAVTFTNQGQISVDPAGFMTIGQTYNSAGGTISGPGDLVNATLQVSVAPAPPTNIILAGADTLATNNPANMTLWVQGNSAIGAATLTVASGLSNSGTLLLQAVNAAWTSTLATGSGTLTNAAGGTIQVSAGTGGGRVFVGNLVNQGLVSVGPSITFTANNTSAAVTFANQGQVTVDPAGFMTIGQTYNSAGGTITGPGDLVNATLQVSVAPASPTTIILAGADTLATNNPANMTLWVQGNSTIGAATLTVASGLSNSGTVLLQAVNAAWTSTLATGTGTLTNAAGGTIQVSAGTGGGRVFVGNLVNQGLVSVGPSITFTANNTSAAVTFTNQGQVAVDPAGFMTIGQTYNSAGGTITGPGDLVNATLVITATPASPTTILLAGADTLATNNPANMTLWVQGNSTIGAATLTVANGLSNSGTVLLQAVNAAWTSTLAAGSSSTFTNAPNGTIQVNAGTGGGRTVSAQLINAGTINFNTNTTFGATGVNDLNASLISIGGGATVTLAGSSFTNQVGGLVSGNGTFTTTGVTVTNNGIIDLTAPTILGVDVELTTVAITYYDSGALNTAPVTNPANYTLLGSGGDGIFGNGNDVNQSGLISQVAYNSTTKTATLLLSGNLPSDFYRVEVNGSAVVDASNVALWPGLVIVNRVIGFVPPLATVSLDPASDSGASNHDGLTNVTKPTFDVAVNQAGTIGIDFDGNGTTDATQTVSLAGTYQFTEPTALANGTYTAAVSFTAATGLATQATTTYTIDTAGPYVTAMSPTGAVGNRLGQLTVTFNKLIDLSTFTPSAVTLTGPGGTIAVSQPQLGSGTTYSISFPTQAIQGTYTLTIAPTVASLAGNQMDQNRNGVNGEPGDSFTGSFTVALPDLAVTTASAPATAAEGTSIAVTWTVANVSTANTATGTWTDAVYVSTRSVLDGSAVRLASVSPAGQSPLGPQASYPDSATVPLPGNIAAGNGYLLFVANDNGGQSEADAGSDTNDVFAVAITLTAPDLRVTGVSGPAGGFTGTNVLVRWTDQNNGTAPASGTWVDNVYVATDAQGDNLALLGSFPVTTTLAVGASVQRSQPVTLPQTAGNYWFTVTTDATQSMPEGTNFGNNTTVAGAPVNVLAEPVPDLVVSGITPPPNGVQSGNTVPLSFVVTNQGTSPTTVPVWQDWVILSQDPTIGQSYDGTNDQVLLKQPVVQESDNPTYLAVGQSYQQNVNVVLPISAQGTWYVYVVPDGTGAHHPPSMREASRTDKLALSPPFTVNLSPPPDLTVPSVQAPAQDFSGKPMTLSWTVANNGTGPTAASAWTDAVYMSTKSTLDASATLLGQFPHQGVLLAGGSYNATQTLPLPVGVSGSFYFLVKTDVNGQVFENGATGNNVGATAAAETVNLTPPPDLQVPSITALPTAQAGHSLSVTYHVTNGGAGGTPNYTWNDAVYLSPTPTFSAGTAIFLGQGTAQGGLAAGAGYDNTVTGTLPNGLTGSYYVLVDTDNGNAVFELSKTNNWGATAGTTQVSAPPPDLTVTAGSAPAQSLAGSAVLVTWTVANQGTGDTALSAWVDNVYASTAATFDSTAVLLGSFPHYGLLGPGRSYTETQLVTLPINFLGGYNLFVVTNATGTVYQPVANNTSTALPSNMNWQLGGQEAAVSDLQVASVTGPATAATGGSVTVNWSVQNNGPGTTNATNWNDSVWMSTNPTLGSGGTDVFLGSVQHTNPLASGGAYSASGTFTLPETLAGGNYYFIVVTDSGDAVYDTNRANDAAAEATPTAVSVSPVPDLAVSNVTAPATATSGATLAVGWTVTNNGAATGNVPITDAVYLSFDQVFDSTVRYLGSVTTPGGLAAGSSYTQNVTLPLPAGVAGTYYVFVVTNNGSTVFELNTADDNNYDPQPVQINLPAAADLVAGTVTVPASAVAGQTITVSYQVTNNGSLPANGSWTDALYLSPTPAWSVSDPLLGRVPQTQDLAAGAGYTGTLTAIVPGVAPGAYYVLLRTNILNTFPEPNLADNLSASAAQVAIDAPALTLGTPTAGTLSTGQAAYYKVVVAAGQTLQVALAGQTATAANELYVSYGTMPTRSQYGYRFNHPSAANQQITVPNTQAGAYYVLVYGGNVPAGPENDTVTAALVPFSVQAVTPRQVGTGPVTLQIGGAAFAFDTTFQLRGAGGAVINATRTLLGDSSTVFATFDLTGRATGSYDVWAIQSGGASTHLASAVQVVPVTPANRVQVQLIVPNGVLVGRPGTITVTYDNPGNTDLPAPLLLLSGQNALFQKPGQTTYEAASLQVFGYNPTGPFGTLPPGFQGSISLLYKPVTVGAGVASNFTLQTLADPAEPFDWGAVAANDVPLNTSAEQWAGFVGTAAAVMGSTWGSVVSFLGNDGVQLLKNAGAAAGGSLYDFDALLQSVVGVYGSASPTAVTPPFPVVASEGEVTLYNAHLDGSGNAVALNPAWPTYVIVHGLSGYRSDFGTLATTIAADTECFPGGQVNVLVATWSGATSGPTFFGTRVPWTAALHIDTAGNELGDLLGSLQQQGLIGTATTTGIGESLGNYVLNAAAARVGGLENIVALNPASALGGYLPPSLRVYFQHSVALETSSFFDTQQALAAANYALETGDLNDPVAQHAFGVSWLTAQIQSGNCGLLFPGYNTGPDTLPPANDPPPPATPQGLLTASAEVDQISSHDPNNVVGPKGCGTNKYVTTDQPLPYQVTFSNTSTTGTPAQKVVITNALDPNLNWGSFRLGNFGFGGLTFTVPANTAYYQTRIDLTQTRGYYVDVTATIDESTGIATWVFDTVSPATGLHPLNPTIGFLPADDSSGAGEGFVNYTIQASPSAPTGTVINAQATVTFDTQPPLATPQIFNTVDAGSGLASAVTALPASESSPQFTVAWSGTDAANASAISGFTIYVSDNGGPYTAWLTNTPLTSAPFVGQYGHTYSFFSQAMDNAGNVEAPHTTPDATTAVNYPAPTTSGLSTTSATEGTSGLTLTVNGTGFFPASVVEWNGTALATTYDSATQLLHAAVPAADLADEGTATVTVFNPTPGGGISNAQTFTITNVAPVAAISGPTDGFQGVQGQTRTFTLTATDPSPVDQAAGFTYTINWGDGSAVQTIPPTANNGAGLAVSHVFTAAGKYNVSVTAADADNVSGPAASPTVTILTVEQQGTGLAVGGTTGNDAFTFTPGAAGGTMTVKLGTKTLGTFTATGGVLIFGQAGTDKVTINGGTGNDNFTVNGLTAALNAFTFVADSIEGWTFNGLGGNNTFTVSNVLKSAPVTFAGGSGGTNTLVGSGAANTWTINKANGGSLTTTPTTGTVSFSQVQDLVGGSGVDWFKFTAAGAVMSINGGGGGDWLDYSAFTTGVTVNLVTGSANGVHGGAAGGVSNIANVRGGAGNDNLMGNGGNILVGGGGNDTLVDAYSGSAASGRSLLIGGAGGDNLTAGSAGDILISGTTSYDLNNVALMAILAEWQSGDDYLTRFKRLEGLQSGGQNGKNTLVWAKSVKDDGTTDTLTGGAGFDWFFASYPGGTDTINNLNNPGPEHLDNNA